MSTNYRGYDVWELPPNTQGLAALQMLNLLEGFDLAKMGRDSADFWHVMVEAKKVAYADRARFYADPAFAKLPLERLLSKEYARERAKKIDMKRASREDPPDEEVVLNRKETTYLCAADASGLMVSLIQSNYTGFGSGYVVPALGIGLQNRGGLFSLKAGHPNRLEPGKRPFQTIIPAFLTKDGQPLMAFGVMGGDMQPQGHVAGRREPRRLRHEPPGGGRRDPLPPHRLERADRDGHEGRRRALPRGRAPGLRSSRS